MTYHPFLGKTLGTDSGQTVEVRNAAIRLELLLNYGLLKHKAKLENGCNNLVSPVIFPCHLYVSNMCHCRDVL